MRDRWAQRTSRWLWATWALGWVLGAVVPSAACTVEPVPQVAQDVSVRGTLARWVADRKLAGPAAGFVVVGRGRDVHLLRDDGTDLGVVAREPEPPSADVDEPRPRRRVGAFLLEDARDLWLLSPSRDGDETQDTWTYIDLEAASPEPLRCPRGLLTKHLDGEVYPGDGRGRILVYQYGGEDYNPKYRPELEIWELSARLGCTATRVTEVLPADGLIHDNSMVGGGVVRMTEASEPDAQLQWAVDSPCGPIVTGGGRWSCQIRSPRGWSAGSGRRRARCVGLRAATPRCAWRSGPRAPTSVRRSCRAVGWGCLRRPTAARSFKSRSTD